MEPDARSLVRFIRRRRTRTRLSQVSWADAAFKVYSMALVAALLVLMLAGLFSGQPLTSGQLATARDRGPGVIGAVALGLSMVGLRSGSRGGPLAVEAAEVQHWWLTPLPRRFMMKEAIVRAVLRWSIYGLVAGAGVAVFAAPRLPGTLLDWLSSAIAVGIGFALLAVAAALWAMGRRLSPARADVLSLCVIAAAMVEATFGSRLLPTTWAGAAALWPLGSGRNRYLVGVLMVVIPATLVSFSWRRAVGASLERQLERSKLIQQLRLAVGIRDVRTVMLLRRRLAQDSARVRPLVCVKSERWNRYPVSRRVLQGAVRWPAPRVGQAIVLGAMGGIALAGFSSGITPLIGVAAVCYWAAALEMAEGLAQDVDHAEFLAGRRSPGHMHVAHMLPTAGLVLIPVGLGSLIYGALGVGGWMTASILAVSASVQAAVGAIVTAIRRPDYVRLVDARQLMSPDIASATEALAVSLPPLITLAGLLPAVAIRSDPTAHLRALTVGIAVPAVAAALTAGWLLIRQPVSDFWNRLALHPSWSNLVVQLRGARQSGRR